MTNNIKYFFKKRIKIALDILVRLPNDQSYYIF